MKIGIISKYYQNFNFGGLLQAYALVDFLNKNGYDSKQISYKSISKPGIKEYFCTQFRVMCRNLIIRIKARKFASPNKKMKLFMKEIPHTKRVQRNLKRLNNQFDAFIAGSDQIWNPAFSCDAYFLYFVQNDKTKISYAASIGITDCNNFEKLYLNEQIKRFDYVSVRESQAKQLLDEIIPEKNISLVLDPVFLLTQNDWGKLSVEDNLKLPDHYALVYLMGNDEYNVELLKKIVNKIDLPVITIPFKISDYKRTNEKYNLGPREFVTLIKNAEVVFTDSFHATSFSIIFERNFYCFSRDGKKFDRSMNSRINNLFELFCIKSRLVYDFDDYVNIGDINDFKSINEKITQYRTISLNYITTALSKQSLNDNTSIII